MDLTLNLFWSQEIPVAENYGFHLETTTSLNHLAGKPGMFWTCEPKAVMGTAWLTVNQHATRKPEFLQFASHSQPSATAKLACAKCHIWTFLCHFIFETKALTQGKRFLSAAQEKAGENGKCHRVSKWLHMKIPAFQITVRIFSIFNQLYCFSHPQSHNFLLRYVQLKVL